MTTNEKLYTVDDLWQLSHDDVERDVPQRYELDEGELIVMAPTGNEHGLIAAEILRRVANFVVDNDLGEVTAAETGFVLYKNPAKDKDIVRAPDVAFIAKARLMPTIEKFYTIAPDFAVEVVSPSDTAQQMRRKADQYLQAGTRLIWVVYPGERFVDVFQPGHDIHTFRGEDVLEGGDVLPDFTIAVNDLFIRLRL